MTGLRKIVWIVFVLRLNERLQTSMWCYLSSMHNTHLKVWWRHWKRDYQKRTPKRSASQILLGRSRKIWKSWRLVRSCDDVGFKCYKRTACPLCNPVRRVRFLLWVVWQRSCHACVNETPKNNWRGTWHCKMV